MCDPIRQKTHSLAGQIVFVHRRIMNRLLRVPSLILMAAAFSIFAYAEDKPSAKKTAAISGELFETIARMDSAIFDAFNAHDVDRLMASFTDDLEFYHDTGGLTDKRQNARLSRKCLPALPISAGIS
jgi:hypothetical protein